MTNGKSLGALLQLVCVLSWGLSAQAYVGYAGRDGYDASNGASGRNGPDVEVIATGQQEYLVLDGSDGGDAYQDGERGGDAYSCYMSYLPAYDVTGAPGGDGGDGGNGGNGGRGGDATIYYTDNAQLKTVTLVSRGGYGGEPSRGGYGGRGCYCERRSWEKRHCREETGSDGKKETKCYDRRYYCHDGRDGVPGSSGYRGSNGRMGRVTLIKSASRLEADVTSKSGTLNELLNREFGFGVNRFGSRTGAVTLLGPGSVVDNSYTEYLRRDIYRGLVTWDSNDDLNDFQHMTTRLYVSGQTVELGLDQRMWAVVEKLGDGNLSTFKVKQALKVADVRAISFQVEGRTVETQLRILGGARLHDRLATSIHLQVWKDRVLFGDKIQYDRVLIPSQITVSGDDLIVNLGRLPTEDKNIFKAKAKIKVQANVTRSLANQSLSVDSGKIEYTIPK